MNIQLVVKMYHVLSWQLSAVTLHDFRTVSRRTNIGRPRFRYYTTYINDTIIPQNIIALVEFRYLNQQYICYKYIMVCSICRTLLEIKSRLKYDQQYTCARFESQAPCHIMDYEYHEYYYTQRHGWFVTTNEIKLYRLGECVATFSAK